MKKDFGERKLYTLDSPKASISESFRMLRTNLMYTNVDREIRVLLFTSGGPGEGKSLVIANLAVVMAQAGKKVILVDCDLRKPVVHEIFQLSNENGVTKYVTGYCTWEEAVQDTQVPNLSVLTSGPIPPNPAELVGSKRMDGLVSMLRDRFEVVLIDSPPVMAVTDSIILGSKADGVVVVIRSGMAKNAAVTETCEQLKKAGANLVGTVLNDVAWNSHYYNKRYGKYYKHYYRNYYEG